MGLVKEDGRFAVLSDIMGDEDHLGDMDFKVAGTARGVNALQMDIKIEGITREIMQQALTQAHAGRIHILERMAETIREPRKEMSEYAPRIITIKIDPEKIRDVIGRGGRPSGASPRRRAPRSTFPTTEPSRSRQSTRSEDRRPADA